MFMQPGETKAAHFPPGNHVSTHWGTQYRAFCLSINAGGATSGTMDGMISAFTVLALLALVVFCDESDSAQTS
jgi:hypothetical protein